MKVINIIFGLICLLSSGFIFSQKQESFRRHIIYVNITSAQFTSIGYEFALKPRWSIYTEGGTSDIFTDHLQQLSFSLGGRWYGKEKSKGLTVGVAANMFTSQYYNYEGNPWLAYEATETRYNLSLMGKVGYTFVVQNRLSIYPFLGLGLYREIFNENLDGLHLEGRHLVGLQLGLRL